MSKERVRKTADDYMREGWSICPALRLLNYKSPLSSAEFFDECYLRVTEDDELADIYIRLGLKMWGRVGTNDLFDKAYVEIIDFAFKNLTDMQTIQLKNNLESIRERKTNPESLKRQGWKICPKTELLSHKPSDKSCDITFISDLNEDKELQIIYAVLAIELWGTAGLFDLLYKDY